MAKTSPSPVCAALPTAGPSAANPIVVPIVGLSIPATAVASETPALVSTAPAPHRYETRVGPAPPSPPHPRPSRRAPPPKRARTSSPGESYSSRDQEPLSPPVQEPTTNFPLDLSPASIIRRPIFHRGPITRNSDCSAKELHDETFYDIPATAALPDFKDSMRLMQRYSLEPFMTHRRFFYP